MASFDDIPLEVKEVIFLYLEPKELMQCSLVCLKWNEIVNSNQIWLRMCSLEGLVGKKYLDQETSMFVNPMKQYSHEARLSVCCHWRSHFNRYKFVKRNWRLGYCVRASLAMRPAHMNNRFIVERQAENFVISDVHGQLTKFTTLPLALPNDKVDTLLSKGDYFVYTQKRHIVYLKREKTSFREVVKVELSSGYCSQPSSNCIKSKLTVRLSDKFLLIQDPMNPCTLCFYDGAGTSNNRRIDLHKALGNQSLYSTCIEVYENKVYLAYKMGHNFYLAEYDYAKDAWETPATMACKATELYPSKKYLGAKLCSESRDHYLCNLIVWTVQPLIDHREYRVNQHIPVILTDSDYLIYSFRDEVFVSSVSRSFETKITVSHGLTNICHIWDRYLVIHDDKGVSVWDWKNGKKIDTPFRNDSCISVCVSETNILLRCERDVFQLVSYW